MASLTGNRGLIRRVPDVAQRPPSPSSVARTDGRAGWQRRRWCPNQVGWTAPLVSAGGDASGRSFVVALQVELGRLLLKNPVMVASGTFGYIREMAGMVRLERLGGAGPQDRDFSRTRRQSDPTHG